MENDKKFIKCYLGVFIGLLCLCGAVVLIVDPFSVYHKPICGFQTVQFSQIYQNPGYIRNYDYDIAVIGTSMTEGIKASEVGNIFEGKAVKLCESGAYTLDISEILELVCENGKAKKIILGIDANMFRKENDSYRNDLPFYLYNDNILDDYNYLFNNQFIFYNSVMMVLQNIRGNVKNLDDFYIMSDDTYSKENALYYDNRYDIPPMTWENAQKNIENIMPYIEDNPDIEFYLFMPPYSVLFWQKYYTNGCVDEELKMHQQIMEAFLKYDNVKLFYFMNDEEIITDLNNYRDAGHYSPKVCSVMVNRMHDGENRITKENYLEILSEMNRFVMSYDYEQIYEPE